MFRTALVPFILACITFVILGFSAGNGGEVPDLSAMFSSEFNLHWASVIPAVVILTLSLLRVKVKFAMLTSIVSAFIVGITVQDVEILEFFKIMILGFKAETAEIKHMIDGGGLVSMLKSAAIVCLSSAYSGIFSATGLLNSLKEKTELLSQKTTPFGATMITSIFTSLISCNQTLAIILTHQLCEGNENNPDKAAIDLENSAVVISPLVPWSIAGAVPLASAGAPTGALLAAGFLYILPIYSFIVSLIRHRKENKS
jgi:NhaC family Na+:H+ antiporter